MNMKSRYAQIVAALIIVVSAVIIPMPQGFGWWQGEAQAAPPEQVPPGQLKRRGFVGIVNSVSSSTTVPVLNVETRFGDVDVLITDDTRIRTPLQEDLAISDIVGSKIAVLVMKGSVQLPEDTDADGPIRTVTAKKIMVVPDKATRTHARAVVKEKLRDRLEVVDENGETIEVDGDETELEEGDGVVLVAARPLKKAKIVVRSIKNSIHISDRLIRVTDKLMEDSDAPALQRLQDRVVNFKEKQEERLDKIEDRIEKFKENNPNARPRPQASDGDANGENHTNEALKKLLARLKNAVQDESTDDTDRPVRDRVKEKATEVIKDRVKERVEKKVETRIKAIRGRVKQEVRNTDEPQDRPDNGNGRVGRVIERIKDTVTSDRDNVIEASDSTDNPERNRRPPIPKVVEKKVKQEIRERVKDRNDECRMVDEDADGTEEVECEDERPEKPRLAPRLSTGSNGVQNDNNGRGNRNR